MAGSLVATDVPEAFFDSSGQLIRPIIWVLFLRFSSGEGLLGKRIIDFVRAKKCVSTSWPDGAASSLRQNVL